MLDLFEENGVISHVNEISPYLEEKLDGLTEKYDMIEGRRGIGLMQGLVCKGPVGDIINNAMEKGLILINAGVNIIRIVPPLIIEKEHVDEMVDILDKCLAEM